MLYFIPHSPLTAAPHYLLLPSLLLSPLPSPLFPPLPSPPIPSSLLPSLPQLIQSLSEIHAKWISGLPWPQFESKGSCNEEGGREGLTEVHLKVTGVTCGSCVANIEKSLAKLTGEPLYTTLLYPGVWFHSCIVLCMNKVTVYIRTIVCMHA